MINCLKKVFKDFTKDTAEDPLVMKVSEFVQPVVKDISEPVLAIVECMKKYPSRFKLDINQDELMGNSWSQKYSVSDVKTGQVLNVTLMYNLYGEDILASNWKWLTSDELDLLKVEFEEIGKIKIQRMYSIHRAKMKGIYK